ncbi:MAG: hypothetical protein HRT68_09010 [Flavobacteriaceae bacterium]|nr:hypothetical protein [Flavobacteriaceae bacterium]
MKKLVVTAILFVGFSVFGQEKHEIKRGKKHFRMAQEFSPEQIATIKSKQMTLMLDLSESQQKQVHKLIQSNIKERNKIREEMKEKKGNGKPNPEMHFERMNKMLDKKNEMKRSLKQILSKEQYEKLEITRLNKKRMMKRKRQMKKKREHDKE